MATSRKKAPSKKAPSKKAPSRKKSAKTQAAERVGELFGDPTPEARRQIKKDRKVKNAAKAVAATEELLEVQRAPSPAESPFGVVLSPESGYRPEPVNADADGRVARSYNGARVVFYEHKAARLEQIDYDEFGDYEPGAEAFGVSKARVDGAYVKVTASLRPSEREAFDGRALKEKLQSAGALAVLLAVRPVAEAPEESTREALVKAVSPEAAIDAWFDSLPIPAEDRDEAKALALEILASDGG